MRPYLTLHHPARTRLYREQGLWRDDTLYGLLARHAAATPHAIALEDGSRRLTWQALQHGVDAALQAVAWNTESLGRNCEYGVVQRRCEAEPVSLLRWSGMPVSKLIEALTHEFSGLMETAIGQEVPLKAPPNSRRWATMRRNACPMRRRCGGGCRPDWPARCIATGQGSSAAAA